MNSASDFDVLQGRVRALSPTVGTRLDSPYSISNELYDALRHVLHDVGGQPDLPEPYLEKVEEDWEMSTYVTCECLAWRGVWSAEDAASSRE